MAHGDVDSRSTTTNRRAFLARLFWSLAALLGGLIGIPIAGSVLSPAVRTREKSEWIAVGPLSAFGAAIPGHPILAHHVHPADEGWVNTTGQMQVWVARSPQGSYRVFDNHCTHLGCPYHWEDARAQFVCPCHNGVFDVDGSVVSGPPPRPLDYYDTKVEAGILYMGAFHRGGT